MKRRASIIAVSLFAALALLVFPSGCMPSIRATSAQLAALESGTSNVEGIAGRVVAYRRAGDPNGQRVILIHGSPGDWAAWGDYLVEPIGDLDLVAVDRLGYGASTSGLDADGQPVKKAVLPYDEQAGALAGLLVERNGRWPIVVGHSLGGPIAARLAADHPGKVDGVLILAGSMDPRFEQPRWYSSLFASPLTRWMLPRPLGQSNREMMATLGETRALGDVLDRVTCRVIVLHGARDSLVPVGNVDYMRAKMTNARSTEFIVLPEQGHFIPWEQEQLVRALIEKLTAPPSTNEPE
jgi:pimeloyl-ACP methyl ester carboxylesterase